MENRTAAFAPSAGLGITTTPAGQPHPQLKAPILFVSGLNDAVPTQAIVDACWECLRLRPNLRREGGDGSGAVTGTIEFEQLENAEKALATVNGVPFPEYNCVLNLHPEPVVDGQPVPSPSASKATPRIFKSLPLDITPGGVFHLCRPFGPVERVTLQYQQQHGMGATPVFMGEAVVVFYNEDDARSAVSELHCSEVGGQTIVVQMFSPRRGPAASWNGSPQSAYPSPPYRSGPLNAVAPSWSPSQPQTRSFSEQSTSSSNGGTFNSPPRHPGGIDPCNLFIKSLDPSITSPDLFNIFMPYGRIISARVSYDDATGLSKEFGFVSFVRPEDAKKAMDSLDGTRLMGAAGVVEGGGRPVVVRIHEPKSIREGKMAVASVGASGRASSNGSPVIRTQTLPITTSHAELSPTSVPDSPTNSQRGSSIKSPPLASERERLLAAVRKLEPSRAEEVVELIEGLPKKERALCLFNPDHLKEKVSDALLVLSSLSDDDEAAEVKSISTNKAIHSQSPPPTISSRSSAVSTLPTPDTTPPSDPIPNFSSSLNLNHHQNGHSNASPGRGASAPRSLAELGKRTCKEIVALIQSGEAEDLGVSRVDAEKERDTREFFEELVKGGKNPVHVVKQKLGERLFGVVKGFKIKGAPRLTIQLLDEEDLESLCLLTDYHSALRAKVAGLAGVA